MNNNKLTTEMMNPEALIPSPWNVNVVSPDNETKLEESIRKFGMFKPVIVREIGAGAFEIIGGEHRAMAAKRLGMKEIPIINLGRIDDKKAKEVGLLDNSRYGSDDTLQLAELLEGLGSIEELMSYMPYGESDLASIFSSVSIELDDLNIPDEDESPRIPTEKPLQTHQVMRFKVPVDDIGMITDLIEAAMKSQKFNDGDSLENAGDALVYLMGRK